jgi:hypothetical protein
MFPRIWAWETVNECLASARLTGIARKFYKRCESDFSRRRHFKLAIAALLLAIVTGGCAGAGIAPSESVTTAVQGWEHYFRLDWAPQRHPGGTEIDGYIYNTYGSPAGSVRLLAQALDASNNVVAQKIEWVPGVVPNFSRSYFRISTLPPADHYRVTVWSFDIIDSDDFRRRRF